MTAAERREIQWEISRLEDLQADSIVDKKTDYAIKNHNKIKKLRKMLAEAEEK